MKMIQLSNRPGPPPPAAKLQLYKARGSKIALPTIDGFLFREVETIISLQAEGNYTNITFIDGTKVLICKTLRNTEAMLKTYPQFIRIHRSYTINLDHLTQYVKGKGGYVILSDKQSLSVSNSRKPIFIDALARYFCCSDD